MSGRMIWRARVDDLGGVHELCSGRDALAFVRRDGLHTWRVTMRHGYRVTDNGVTAWPLHEAKSRAASEALAMFPTQLSLPVQ